MMTGRAQEQRGRSEYTGGNCLSVITPFDYSADETKWDPKQGRAGEGKRRLFLLWDRSSA